MGADGPGADAWLMWQTWQVASVEGALWKWISEPVVNATTVATTTTARKR
ncbi:MAG TPA: hypothetical protein VN727_01425 [Candidatus Binatia bacterium]|nr:hypothetical protein [Candidatus Binatia bacterium]